MSFAIEGLLDHVGAAWTFRILGFITLLFTLPAAFLMKERRRPKAELIDLSVSLFYVWTLVFCR
jgi:hypothetical protein